MTKKVYLISCSGRPNYGDELITASWLSYLYRYFPEYEVWLDCPEPGNAFPLFSNYHPNFRPINLVWKLCWRYGIDLNTMVDNVAQVIKNYGSPDIDSNIAVFRSADIVHILGGGYINSNWKENYTILVACQELTKISSVKTYATGLGLIPHHEPEHKYFVEEAISTFTDFQVRDNSSSKIYNVFNGNDDAFLGLALNIIKKPTENMVSSDILCCIQDELAEKSISNNSLSHLIEYLLKKENAGNTIGYCEAIPGTDRTAYEIIRKSVPGIKFYSFTDTWFDGLPFNPKTKMITTRFHHHLIGAMLGIKGIALLIDHNYYENKHNSLMDIGTGWFIANNNSLAFDDLYSINGDFYIEAERISQDKLNLAKKIYCNFA